MTCNVKLVAELLGSIQHLGRLGFIVKSWNDEVAAIAWLSTIQRKEREGGTDPSSAHCWCCSGDSIDVVVIWETSTPKRSEMEILGKSDHLSPYLRTSPLRADWTVTCMIITAWPECTEDQMSDRHLLVLPDHEHKTNHLGQ